MTAARTARRLSLQALYQFDLRNDDDAAAILESLREEAEERSVSEASLQKAVDVAQAAYKNRDAADAVVAELTPLWPTHRQPAIDRSILRLAHHEMAAELAPPKVVVNEAIELAKVFGTERSPAFINGVLDKILKQFLQASAPAVELSEESPNPSAIEE